MVGELTKLTNGMANITECLALTDFYDLIQKEI